MDSNMQSFLDQRKINLEQAMKEEKTSTPAKQLRDLAATKSVSSSP